MKQYPSKSMQYADTEPAIFERLRDNFWQMLRAGNPDMTEEQIQSVINDNEGLPFDYWCKRVGDTLVVIPQTKTELKPPTKVFIPQTKTELKPPTKDNHSARIQKTNPNQLSFF